MRRIAVLFLAFGAALAQEDPRARARDLELRAGKALDEGRRADALKLLAEAADAREGKLPKAPDPKPEAIRTEPARAAADLAEMEGALQRGEAAAALAAGLRAREALAAWAKDLEARERRRAEEEVPVEERLERLARQIEEYARRVRR